MKILVDENIPKKTCKTLLDMENDVLDIRGTEQEGLSDDLSWKIALDEERVLITTDKGFAYHRDDNHFGILIVALRQPTLEKIHKRVIEAIEAFTPKQWKSLLVIMRDKTMSTWRPEEK